METFPLDPLLAIWRERNPEHQQSRCTCTIGGSCASAESLARQVAVSHSTMHRRLRGGFVTAYEADMWACAVGVPVHAIWPEFGRDDWEPDAVVVEVVRVVQVGCDVEAVA